MAPRDPRRRRGRRRRADQALDRGRHARPDRSRRPSGGERGRPRRRRRAGRRRRGARHVPAAGRRGDSAAVGATESWAPHAAAEVGRLVGEGVDPRRSSGRRPTAATSPARWSARSAWGLLANAGGVTWGGDGPVVEAMRPRRPRRSRSSALTGDRGIVTVRPNAVDGGAGGGRRARSRRDAAEPAPRRPAATVARPGRRGRRGGVARGGADRRRRRPRRRQPGGLRASSRSSPRRSAAWSARRARRSTPAGSRTPARSARRARSSSRRCTSGSGCPGAMQHRVGMQSADAIVIVNRDPDAPIAEVADLFVDRRPVRGRARRSSPSCAPGAAADAPAGRADGGTGVMPQAALIWLVVLLRPGRPVRAHACAGCRR